MVAAAAAAQAARNAEEKKKAESGGKKPKSKTRTAPEGEERPPTCWDKANSYKLPKQQLMKDFYEHPKTQKFVASLICLNFLCTIIEKQMDPPMGEKYADTWQIFNDLFNVVFLGELAINYWGHAYFQFFTSSWNVFDCIVCTMGALGLARVELRPPLTLLRCFRAFRVFRLFKRIPSLNKIMVSLAKAVPGVVNAFAIMLIVMSIYAIIAVEFFAEFGKAGYYNTTIKLTDNTYETVQIDSTTARGMFYGFEYYGAFDRALYTLWQVLTGESWSEAVARPLIFGTDSIYAEANAPWIASFYFVSFLMVNGIVLINVVVAVLLEKMVADDPDDDDEEEEEGEGDDAADQVTYVAEVEATKLGGVHAVNGGDANVAALAARLDRLDKRFDEQQRLLEKVLAALDGGAATRNGMAVEELH